MLATVDVSADRVTSHWGAVVTVSQDGGNNIELLCKYRDLLRTVPNPTERTLDLLNVAATVYVLDKATARRRSGGDGWTRDFEVRVPVVDSGIWNTLAEDLERCVGFLSGDRWRFQFRERDAPLVVRPKRRRRRRSAARVASGDAACLFSGGLDSLVGAVDDLAAFSSRSLSLVGHYDPSPGTVQKDQERLHGLLSSAHPGRLDRTSLCVGSRGSSPESTMRSRSLLFIATGVCVAEHLGDGVPLLVPENGTIALNVPLTPARRGTCSTRTTHPHFMSLLQDILYDLGLRHELVNPLLGKTKGEVVTSCLDRPLLEKAAPLSKSCAKPGHTSHWTRGDAGQCGRCMPCIYRRAALHAAGMDRETYGNDVCTGEVNPVTGGDAADDLRACLSYLKQNHTRDDLARKILSSGPVPLADLGRHADTVFRASEELRALLRAKATPDIRRLAGV